MGGYDGPRAEPNGTRALSQTQYRDWGAALFRCLRRDSIYLEWEPATDYDHLDAGEQGAGSSGTNYLRADTLGNAREWEASVDECLD